MRGGGLLAHASLTLLFVWSSVMSLSMRWVNTGTEAYAITVGVLFIALLLAVMGRLVDRRDAHRLGTYVERRTFDRGDLAFGVLLGVWLAASAETGLPEGARRLGVLLVVTFGGSHAIGWCLARSPQLPRQLAIVPLAIAVAVGLYGLCETIVGDNPLCAWIGDNPFHAHYRDLGRPIATLANPAPLGTYLLAMSFVAGGAALPASPWATARSRWSMAGCLVAVLWIGVLTTGSRGAFLGLVAAIATLVRRPRAIAIGAGGVLAVMAIASLLPPPYDQLGFWRVLGTGGLLAQDRGIRADAAFAMWRDHPLLGVGFDQYPRRFADYADLDPSLAHLGVTPDNAYVTLLTENGIVGLMAFVVFAGGLLLRAWRAQRQQAAPRLLRLATAGFVGLLVNACGYSCLYWTVPCLLLGFTSGVVRGLCPPALLDPSAAETHRDGVRQVDAQR